MKRGCLTTNVLIGAVISAAAVAGCTDSNGAVLPPAPPNGIKSLTAPSTGIADGLSQTAIVASVDTSVLPVSQWPVTISSTAGIFTFSGKQFVTLTPNAHGVATVFLQAPHESVTVYLVATVSSTQGSFADTAKVAYSLALPDGITVVPAALSIAAGPQHSLPIVAHLLRRTGAPSPGAIVVFSAVDSNSQPRGHFSPALPSDSVKDTVSVLYTSTDTYPPPYLGRIVITATTRRAPDQAGDTLVSANDTIYVTPDTAK